ncbi:MAG: ornithine carbamoyltransferase [Thaumarchaeota archaeon]|nr:ornithine carbamoyltransferase [Nitrososphaerota archaeon]
MTEYTNEEPTGFSKDLLSLAEFSPSEFRAILTLADTFKVERESRRFAHQIPGTSLALLFEKPSTRTRVSFEVAMYELGGHAVVLNPRDMQSSRGETPEDTARALSTFCHAIAARVSSHSTLETYARAATVPVVNALSDVYHPCQTVADIQTIKQFKKKIKGVRIAWVGDGNNVCNSLLIGAALSGAHMTVASPAKYSPLPEALVTAKHQSEYSGSEIEVTDSAREAVKGADVVVTDTFVSMGQDIEKSERLKDFLPDFQVNDELMSLAKRDAIFMHCLPAHRGEEVAASVIDGPQSVVWQEAENRLHGQKAVLYTLLKKYARSQKDKVYIGSQI